MTTQVRQDEVVGKITRRLIPFLWLLFIVNYLDRTNVAMAKLQMTKDVNLSDYAYSIGAGLFFWGYFLFEVPSNLILQRVGAKRWIARIMISWGMISALLMFTRGPHSFYALRFILGVAEAGFFPGLVLYLTYWISHKHRARIMALFLTATAVSGLIGNPLAGAIMTLEGMCGLHGWQWLFLIEGVPPILLGILILTTSILPDRPAEAKWLNESERQWIENELAAEHSNESINHITDFAKSFADSRLWLLSALYFLLIMGLYGFVYWVPTIVQEIFGGNPSRVGRISAIPYLVATITMILIGRHADRRGKRRPFVSICAAVGAVGIALLTLSNNPLPGMFSLCLAAIGIFGSLGPFWCLPTRYLRGTAAAGGIAMINSTGALAGSVAPPLIGWAKTSTGHMTAGLLVVAASLAAGAILVLLLAADAD